MYSVAKRQPGQEKPN